MSLNPPPSTRIALVVDDEPSVRFYHSYILKCTGFHCEAARDSEEALQKIEHIAIDLAVINVLLPVLNGLELIRQIRSKPGLSRLPIIVVSSEPIEGEIAAISGPISFAKKPLSPDSVITEIRRLMSAV